MGRIFGNIVFSILIFVLITCVGILAYIIFSSIGVNNPAVDISVMMALLLTNEYRNRMDKRLFK